MGRETFTGIPKPFAAEEDDCWSEPDKDEARRRMGLEAPETVVVAGRTTDDEGVIVRGKEGLHQELRRERAKVARLGGEADRMRRELETSKQDVERHQKRLEEAESIVRELNKNKNEIKGNLRNVYDQLEATKGEFDERVRDLETEKESSKIEIKKLKQKIKMIEEEYRKQIEEQEIEQGKNQCEVNRKIRTFENEKKSLENELTLWKERSAIEELKAQEHKNLLQENFEEETKKTNALEERLNQEQRKAEAVVIQFKEKISEMAFGLANE